MTETTMSNMSALLIFIKNPEKGKVKTRLAATVGDTKALAIYRQLLEHTCSVATQWNGKRYLFYSQFIAKNDRWSPDLFDKYVQRGADLGKRMQYAFEQVFDEGHEKVVIIGSDCAALTTELLTDAFERLEQHDFVLGPAIDGGYYLLGMRSFEPIVFEDIAWSTSQVLSKTVQNIQSIGKTYTLLSPLSDIDTAEDWAQWNGKNGFIR